MAVPGIVWLLVVPRNRQTLYMFGRVFCRGLARFMGWRMEVANSERRTFSNSRRAPSAKTAASRDSALTLSEAYLKLDPFSDAATDTIPPSGTSLREAKVASVWHPSTSSRPASGWCGTSRGT